MGKKKKGCNYKIKTFKKKLRKCNRTLNTIKQLNLKDLTKHKDKSRYKNRYKLSPSKQRKYKKTVDYIHRSQKERHLPKYNYCGPGTKFWVRNDEPDLYSLKMKLAGKKKTGTKPYGKPYNAYDSCCQKHDYDYNMATNLKDVREADDRFLKCLKSKKDQYKKKRELKNMTWSKEWLDYVTLKNVIKNKNRLEDLNFKIVKKRL